MQQSFWEHLDVLRSVIIRCVIACTIATIGMFFCKDWLFNILFAPSQPDFVLYRALCRLSLLLHFPSLCPDSFDVSFINTELTAQFMTHLQVALWSGLILAMPYIIYQLYGFISPALYQQEKHYTVLFISVGTLLFFLGVALNYFIIFPLSFRFLSTYQVQAAVVNQISLGSYISTFLILSLLMGVMFELPILTFTLSQLGLLTSATMRQYRRHVFVIILIIAAIITPTGDIFTLLIVSLPIYLLYEISIWINNIGEYK